MSRYIQGDSRKQYQFMTINFDELIPEKHPVRAIDKLVDSFDIKSMGFTHSFPAATGRKSFDPRIMIKLYVYGFFNETRTSRKLEKLCHNNIEVMWLLDNLKPDDKTIANFRKDNPKALKKVFTEFSIFCEEMNLFSQVMISVDGTKFKANNSKKKNYTKNKLENLKRYCERKASYYLRWLSENDQKDPDDLEHDKKLAEVMEGIKKYAEKINELNRLEQRLAEEGEVSLTDPDARQMPNNMVGYTVQTAVDEKYHLVSAAEVNNHANDQNHLYGTVIEAMKNMGMEIPEAEESKSDEPDTEQVEVTASEQQPEQEAHRKVLDMENPAITVMADAGYYSGKDLKKCMDQKIKTIVPPNENKDKKTNGYSLQDFTYDPETDSYLCPMGQRLTNKSKKTSSEKIYNNYEACRTCINKKDCTKHEKGRKLYRNEFTPYLEKNREVYEANKQQYKKRQEQVEHPFGTIKSIWGFDSFLTRGLESVQGEVSMAFFTYNFKRVLNIFGVLDFIDKIREITEQRNLKKAESIA